MTGITTVELVIALAILALILYFVFASFAFGAGYQPTPRAIVRRMLDLGEVGPEDTVYDLGAGTGAIVFAAVRERGARALGVEVEPLRVLILELRRRLGPGADQISIRWGDFFKLDFRSATVVTVFLWPGAMARLKPRFEAELKKGARVVSYYHPIPGWAPSVRDDDLRVFLYRR
jgi:precorrin-6B methylase 2